jgi:tetratricopeptide (TPR) repeat protein
MRHTQITHYFRVFITLAFLLCSLNSYAQLGDFFRKLGDIVDGKSGSIQTNTENETSPLNSKVENVSAENKKISTNFHDEQCPSIPDTEAQRISCERLLEKDSKNADLYFNIANFYFITKKNKELAKAWRDKGISINPEYWRSYVNKWHLAINYDQNYNKAIDFINKAIELKSDEADNYIRRGQTWQNMKAFDKAEKDYSKAIDLNSNNYVYYQNRANVRGLRDDHRGSLADITEAIRLKPNDSVLYTVRSFDLDNLDRPFDAIADTKKAIQLDPKNFLAFRQQAVVKIIKLKDYEGAILDLNEAIKINPNFSEAYFSRGVAWGRKGNNTKAVMDYKESIRLDPNQEDAKRNLANVEQLAKLFGDRRIYGTTEVSPSSPSVSLPVSQGKRAALILGNSNYKHMPKLDNPKNDAQLMAKTLKEVGFEVVQVKLDLSRLAMIDALKDFESIARDSNEALIYYAGHGLEINGVNFAIPIDVNAKDEHSVPLQAINMQEFLISVEAAKGMRLVILDACRDNALGISLAKSMAIKSKNIGTASSTIGRGLARVEPQPGTLVVYATKAGDVAEDGDDSNSPFTEALSKRILQKPTFEVRRLFDYVREDVFVATKKRQQPFAYGSLSAKENFFFIR